TPAYSAGAPPGKTAFRCTPSRGSKRSKSGCSATECATSTRSMRPYNPPARGTRSWEFRRRTDLCRVGFQPAMPAFERAYPGRKRPRRECRGGRLERRLHGAADVANFIIRSKYWMLCGEWAAYNWKQDITVKPI